MNWTRHSFDWVVLAIVIACAVGCGKSNTKSAAPNGKSLPAKTDRPEFPKPVKHKPAVAPQFVNVAKQSGIDFTFFSDAVSGRFLLPEIMGGGAAWFDFDLDGLLDLYVVDGAQLENPDPRQTAHVNRLFRNLDARSFDDVTSPAHAGHNGYGQGIAVGDFDADGFPDLYVANYGANVLLHNNGDGTFEDVTRPAGVGGGNQWSSSVLWLDVDADGDLDLYVVNYMNVSMATHKICLYGGKRGYCGPGSFRAVDDLVYLNSGDGRFVESAKALGLWAEDGKGLAIAAADFDGDLKPEIYVANDMCANFMFTRSRSNAKEGVQTPYRNVASAAGCALDGSGINEASMGVACGDFNGDGLPDLFLTHYYQKKNTLYANRGNLVFSDDSRRSRVAATSFDFLGFGTAALDYDRNGTRDLFIANGHVLGPEQQPGAMRPQLLENVGPGRFEDVSDYAGGYFQELWLGRGTAPGDYDNDGDVDLAVTHLERPLALLRNGTRTSGHWLGLSLRTPQRIPPVGGRVVVTAGERRWVHPIVAGGSYLSSGDPRLLMGLGDAAGPVQVTIHWPSGRLDAFRLAVDRYFTIMEGQGPEESGSR